MVTVMVFVVSESLFIHFCVWSEVNSKFMFFRSAYPVDSEPFVEKTILSL